jgi:hypothetical protein
MRTWSVKGLWFVHRLFVENFGYRNYTDNVLFDRVPLMIVLDKSWVQISVCRSTISTDISIFNTLPELPECVSYWASTAFFQIFLPHSLFISHCWVK